MTAANYEMTVEAGSTFQLVLTLRDSSDDLIDLTGYTSRMMVRPATDSPVLYLSLTSPSTGLTMGGALGTVTIDLTATQTKGLKFNSAIYDLEIVSSGETVTRVIEGDFIVKPRVNTA